MSYIVTRSFYEGNTLHEAGSVFEHTDQAYVEKCLADGNIADDAGVAESSAPLDQASSSVPESPDASESVAEVPTNPEVQISQVEPNGFPIQVEQDSSVQSTESQDNSTNSNGFAIS